MRRLLVLVVVAISARAVAQPSSVLVSGERRLSTGVTDSDSPRLSSDGVGQFVLVWKEPQNAMGHSILARRFSTTGDPLGDAVRVNTTNDTTYDPVPAMDQTGASVVTWSGDAGVLARRYSSAGEPLGMPFQVGAYTTNEQGTPTVGMDAAGNFVVVWWDFARQPAGAWGQRYASSGTPLGSAFPASSSGGFTFQPSVARAPGGQFVVSFGTGDGLTARRFAADGSPLGSDFPVAPTASGKPVLAMGEDGRFVFAWEKAKVGGSEIEARRYSSSGVPLGAIESVTSDGQRPSVAVTGDGGYIVTWQTGDGSGFGIFGRSFAPDGAPLTDAMRLNSYTTGGQDAVTLAPAAGAGYTVAWSSERTPYTNYGMLAREPRDGRRGDANGDGATTVADVFFLINFLFAGGPPPL